ncbi:MAG: thiamine diphosphokinase [Oscillospiraceae bacterium]|nr:thiamine diphosphokinase [Oscillospiraceae bacterium]
MNKNCYIVGAGEHYSNDLFTPGDDDLVIAADGGYTYLYDNDIRPHIIIGDFDSSDTSENDILLNCPLAEIIRMNPVKDDTDMLSAINIGLHRDCDSFHIYGGTGGRIEHTIANIQNMSMIAKRGRSSFLYSKEQIMTVIHNNSISFDEGMSGYISVFSLDNESLGVTETGFKYRLDKYDMSNHYPIGVSNEFTGSKCSISVENGTLLIIYPR